MHSQQYNQRSVVFSAIERCGWLPVNSDSQTQRWQDGTDVVRQAPSSTFRRFVSVTRPWHSGDLAVSLTSDAVRVLAVPSALSAFSSQLHDDSVDALIHALVASRVDYYCGTVFDRCPQHMSSRFTPLPESPRTRGLPVRQQIRWLSWLWLYPRHWPSLLSTGLLAGRRRHWSVTSPLCSAERRYMLSDQNSGWST